MRRVAVIGAGTFGMSVAERLVEIGCEVVVADHDEEKVREAAAVVPRAVQINVGDEQSLKAAGVADVDAAVVAIGDEIDASVLATMLLKDLGVGIVMSKANSEVHGKLLARCGADRVIFPEREVGIRVAHILQGPNVLDYIEVASGVALVELPVDDRLAGKTLKDTDIRRRFQITVLALKRPGEGLVPEDAVEIAGPDTLLEEGAIMLLIGREERLQAFEKTMRRPDPDPER